MAEDEQRLGTTIRGYKKTPKHIPGTKGCPAELGNHECASYSVITSEAKIPRPSKVTQLKAYYNICLVPKNIYHCT